MTEDDPSLAPRQRDAERTQKAILAAAVQEFAAHGLAGARVERIADRAGVAKRLIFYYFDNKENLFRAALHETYSSIRDAEKLLRLHDLSPTDGIRRLVEFTWAYYLEHPEFLTLLNSENLHRARHISGSPDIQEINFPLIQTLGDILERGRRDGVFRGGVDPVQLYISIAGLAYFYLSNNATLSVVFARDLMATKALNERLSHIIEVILGYVVR
jgi:AcrR family transcriptional regulator